MALWVSKVGCSYHGVSLSPFLDILNLNQCRTCFWGGETFAPKLMIKDTDGTPVNVQQFLQNAILNMFEVVVGAVGDLEGVLGFQVRSLVSFWHLRNDICSR